MARIRTRRCSVRPSMAFAALVQQADRPTDKPAEPVWTHEVCPAGVTSEERNQRRPILTRSGFQGCVELRFDADWSPRIHSGSPSFLKTFRFAFVILALLLGTSCTAIKLPQQEVLAFPGAQGYGRFAIGGRGGQVIRVTNLSDSGPGSLRQAIEAEGARTIVFGVSGYIDLQSELNVENGYVTIAGQTAPGDGITLRRHSLNVRADHVIVRYIRSRPSAAAKVGTDAISIYRGHNIIIDHCSTSWGTDETLSISPSGPRGLRSIDNITVQWSIIAESLNNSVHDEGAHGFGSLLRGSGGARYTLHHNLWAHHRGRMPRPGNYVSRDVDPIGPVMDFRSNVFYNWGGTSSGYNADSESLASYSFVGNHYVAGPNTAKRIAFRESNPHARLYFSDNRMNGELIADQSDLLELPEGHELESEDFVHGYVLHPNGLEDFNQVLRSSGASLSRDSADARVVEDVRALTGRIIDDVSETPGWPTLNSLPAPLDSDGDGMPDAWELSAKLDPFDPAEMTKRFPG